MENRCSDRGKFSMFNLSTKGMKILWCWYMLDGICTCVYMIFVLLQSHQCASRSRSQSASSIDTLRIICWLWVYIFSELSRLRNRSASSVDILQTVLIEDSCQLRASVFSNPLIGLLPSMVYRKGRAPDQLQDIDILQPFDSFTTKCNQSTERGGPPVSFKHRYSSTLR